MSCDTTIDVHLAFELWPIRSLDFYSVGFLMLQITFRRQLVCIPARCLVYCGPIEPRPQETDDEVKARVRPLVLETSRPAVAIAGSRVSSQISRMLRIFSIYLLYRPKNLSLVLSGFQVWVLPLPSFGQEVEACSWAGPSTPALRPFWCP